MRTLRTKRETTPEGFHDEVLSDHIARNREASQQVNDPRSLPATRVARVGLEIVADCGFRNLGESCHFGNECSKLII